MKDTRTENFLNQMSANFEYDNDIMIEWLPSDWREDNPSRPVPMRDDVVLEYATLENNGSPAPAPILYKIGHKKYGIIDGRQRIGAKELREIRRFSAYVVLTKSENLIMSLKMLANARLQGRAESPEWTRRRAVEVLVVERGMSAAEVARMGGWPVADIAALTRTLQWDSLVQGIGGPELPDTVLSVVSEFVTEENLRLSAQPASEFLRVLKLARFAAEDARPYVEDFFKPVTKSRNRHKILVDRLEEFKTDPEVQIRLLGRGKTTAPDMNLRKALRSVITTLNKIDRSGVELLYMEEFFKLSSEIERKLRGLSRTSKKRSPRKAVSTVSRK